jgi:outer membrane protein assembly factor BamD (BamD/ComL family)
VFVRQIKRLVAALSILGITVAASAASADEPRTRKLTYDPERKEWVEVPPPPLGTPQGDLFAIRTRVKSEDYGAALKALKRFEKAYGVDHPLHPDALLAKARALIGEREYYKAHGVLQEFLSRYAGMAQTSEALRLEFVIAETFLTGTRRKWLGMRILSGEDVALSILDEISAGYPEDPAAPLAIKTKADYYFRTGDHALAELEYARLLRDYPNNRYRQYALRRSADAALAGFHGIEYDEAALIEAEERFNDYGLQYPSARDHQEVDVILDGIGENRAAKELAIASYYERTGHLTSAVFYYRLVKREWPDSVAAVQATRRLELLGALDRNAGQERERTGAGE